MLIALIPMLVMIVGILIWVLSSNTYLKEIGKIMMIVGMFFTVWPTMGKGVPDRLTITASAPSDGDTDAPPFLDGTLGSNAHDGRLVDGSHDTRCSRRSTGDLSHRLMLAPL
jgi:hypothetical protein